MQPSKITCRWINAFTDCSITVVDLCVHPPTFSGTTLPDLLSSSNRLFFSHKIHGAPHVLNPAQAARRTLWGVKGPSHRWEEEGRNQLEDGHEDVYFISFLELPPHIFKWQRAQNKHTHKSENLPNRSTVIVTWSSTDILPLTFVTRNFHWGETNSLEDRSKTQTNCNLCNCKVNNRSSATVDW